MDNHSVSVITLTYKNYNRLFDTILSVLNQDYPAFEYIISDDGSGNFPKDDVLDFVNKNKKDNLLKFDLVLNQENVGTVKHLNNAIRRCSGEYIFDISCNDFFINNHVITKIVQEFKKEQCDVLIISRVSYRNGKTCSICPHRRDWKNVLRLDSPYKRYSALMRTEHFGMFIGPNVYYKREIIEQNGYFDENYILFEDAPMIGKMLWNNKVSIRPDLFAVYYDNETGVSSKKNYSPILRDDVKKYNLVGKMDHFSELDLKTRYHIRFGIERAKARNKVELAWVCIKFFPRIISYVVFNLNRLFNSLGDKAFIKKYFTDGTEAKINGGIK